MDFVRGMRSRFAGWSQRGVVEVAVTVATRRSTEIDVCCFGLDTAGRLSDDRYMVFYNQPEAPDRSICLVPAPAEVRATFVIDVDRLPQTLSRLCFTASIDGDEQMSDLLPGQLRVSADGVTLGRFTFSGADFGPQRSLILAELYRNQGWRLWAVGQGFAAGLDSLLAHYGGQQTDAAPTEDAPPPSRPAPASPSVALPSPLDTGVFLRPSRPGALPTPLSLQHPAPLPAAPSSIAPSVSTPSAPRPAPPTPPPPIPPAPVVPRPAAAVPPQLSVSAWSLPKGHIVETLRVSVDGVPVATSELRRDPTADGRSSRYTIPNSSLRSGSIVRVDYDVDHARD